MGSRVPNSFAFQRRRGDSSSRNVHHVLRFSRPSTSVPSRVVWGRLRLFCSHPVTCPCRPVLTRNLSVRSARALELIVCVYDQRCGGVPYETTSCEILPSRTVISKSPPRVCGAIAHAYSATIRPPRSYFARVTSISSSGGCAAYRSAMARRPIDVGTVIPSNSSIASSANSSTKEEKSPVRTPSLNRSTCSLRKRFDVRLIRLILIPISSGFYPANAELRRGRDSNPRNAHHVLRFSRPLH
jgi:hypothetical protein